MTLYKYVCPERIDVLRSGLIAYPPPWSFNDPFEARPVYPADDPEAVALAEKYRPVWNTLSDAEQETILARLRDIESAHGARRLTLEHASTIIGVLSLSETRDNLLMWAHYTKQHAGFVIGFDTSHPAWTALQSKYGAPGEPTKIIYSDRPMPKTVFEMTPEHIWYTKSSEWVYEQEWRFTRLLRMGKAQVTVEGVEIPLFEFPKEAVSEVILGCRASDILEGEIKQLLFEPSYRSFKVLRAELDRHQFKLNIVRL